MKLLKIAAVSAIESKKTIASTRGRKPNYEANYFLCNSEGQKISLKLNRIIVFEVRGATLTSGKLIATTKTNNDIERE